MRSESHAAIGRPAPIPPPQRSAAPALGRRQWRQISGITLVALGVFALLRWLPTGTNLSHMDFRVDAKNPIDFCDPLNPQFIPVVAVPSPVSLVLASNAAVAGQAVDATVRLTTASGKPIVPADLLVVHTERLHLLIVDPTLTDYQHVHPSPGAAPGAWNFRFMPQRAGTYRVFADFTPAATNRGLYASADLEVAATGVRTVEGATVRRGTGSTEEGAGSTGREVEHEGAALRRDPGAAVDPGVELPPRQVVARDGYQFRLVPAQPQLRARDLIDLKFTVESIDGGRVQLQPVMGAFAHLVAFDEARSGFAHLHPMQPDLSQPPDAVHPTLEFKITIPQPGRYVIWAQVNLGGRDVFVPFWIDVT